MKPVTVRIILALALHNRWSLRQLDINNAFLNGTLHEEVYLDQPPGYSNPQFPSHVCRLRKALYGLKQAPRAWYTELSNFLIGFGFRKSRADASLFIYTSHGVVMYFLVYVDDIVLTGNDTPFIDQFVSLLAQRFSLKDMGMLSHFLGMEVIPTSAGLFLSQAQYITEILSRFHMDGAKPVSTPMSSTDKLPPANPSAAVDISDYRRLLGLLQYLSLTRPDVSYATNRLSQYMHGPVVAHWLAAKRILRYLKGSTCHGLLLRPGKCLSISAFADADWGGLGTSGKSTTAYVVYFGSSIVSWKSSLQKSVSRSSTEAEYRALANATAEVLWIQNLLRDIDVVPSSAPSLFCDNLSATYVCKNPVFHSRMKHLSLDYFFVRDLVAAGQLHVHHVPSKAQLADVLTKPLGRALFLHFRPKIGVSDGSSILRGRDKDKH
ncbi:unnamed protein product [Cuscuta epithymum]|uniref:Reverse transcriptase Ty1/copia-type domain-containing protein n=1 Tax=Cuscuta epithymum TaxID=186058 RepID=A0AAV0FCH1_9ASTE|nr:unnamed protein product [Cuscuta epithymum]